MSYTQRAELYRLIEAERQRPLLCYVTSSRPNANGTMDPDVIPELAKQIYQIPQEKDEVDLLIVSDGGDPTVSWRIICMLRERFKKIGVLLPYAAYSAATLLALGADQILMHPFSNLGPVDPQLHYVRRQGMMEEVVHFGSEDLKNYFDFIRKDVGISDQELLQRSFEMICKDVGSIPIGVAKRSSYLALSMGEKLLSLHMKDDNKVRAIAEALNTSFYHHGYPVGRKEAKAIGLPVENPSINIENYIWQVWQDVEAEMECTNPFNPMEVLFSDPAIAAQLGNSTQSPNPDGLPPQTPPADPPNTPPDAPPSAPASTPASAPPNTFPGNPPGSPTPPVHAIDFSVFQATIESTRCRSEYRTDGKIYASRNPDLTISVSIIAIHQRWQHFSNQNS